MPEILIQQNIIIQVIIALKLVYRPTRRSKEGKIGIKSKNQINSKYLYKNLG